MAGRPPHCVRSERIIQVPSALGITDGAHSMRQSHIIEPFRGTQSLIFAEMVDAIVPAGGDSAPPE